MVYSLKKATRRQLPGDDDNDHRPENPKISLYPDDGGTTFLRNTAIYPLHGVTSLKKTTSTLL
jgi:hypothetical protein